MTKMQPVAAVQDDSCHWYVIPAAGQKDFYKDCEDEEMADDGRFDNKWGQYRTGGDLNLVQLYAEI